LRSRAGGDSAASSAHLPHLPPPPTRRSADLRRPPGRGYGRRGGPGSRWRSGQAAPGPADRSAAVSDRPPRSAPVPPAPVPTGARSEEHTSELQSRENLVCRLLLEIKERHETP